MKSSKNNELDDATIIQHPKYSDNDETVINFNSAMDDMTVVQQQQGIRTQQQEQKTAVIHNTNVASAANVSKTLTVGSILQRRFVLKEVLGSGGMGTVYRATDLRRQEAQDQQPDVAIKVLNNEYRDDPELFIALQRETKKTQLLAHPNIVTVYDFDRDGSHVFMVMALLEGKSLSQFIREDCVGGMAFKKANGIIRGLALALAYAHKNNIIHSDFKPGNVFITDDDHVKVLDFGIACAAVRNESEHDETVFNARDLGALTPAYASLEMIQGKDPDPSDDVYALACVCYEILSGKHPYGKLSAEKALEVSLDVPVIKGLNRRQQNALNRALALTREQRTATVDTFLDDIEPQVFWPKLLIAMVIIASLGLLGSYYYVFNELDIVNDSIIKVSEEQKLAIKDFLELADIHFEVGYLTAPSGSNALWAYRQVLAIDPYNKNAQKGLKKIAVFIKNQAFELYDSGDYKASLMKVEEGLEAAPKDESLLNLKNQILKTAVLN